MPFVLEKNARAHLLVCTLDPCVLTVSYFLVCYFLTQALMPY